VACEPVEGASGGQLRIAVSRTRPPVEASALAERLGAVLVPMGSAGAKAMAVVGGEVDAYVHSGGQYEWDSAAPVAVATAAGFHASRLDGSPLEYNQHSPWLPDLLICRLGVRDRLLGALNELRPSPSPSTKSCQPVEGSGQR
jgi:3'(2'), 5'-bisphosphate nucleotidase